MTNFNNDNSCFELFIYGERAYIECKVKEDVIYMIHTIVPESLRGNKIAEMLVQESLEICVERNWKVVPLCPYVLAYLKRHKEYQSLVREKDREKYLS